MERENILKIKSDLQEIVIVKKEYFEMQNTKKLELLELLEDFVYDERRKIKSI